MSRITLIQLERHLFGAADILDTIIGLASNLFSGTGIPACILILRSKDTRPVARHGKVLFINADAEYRTGRAQKKPGYV